VKKTILIAILIFTTLLAACTGGSNNTNGLSSNVPPTLMPTNVPPTEELGLTQVEESSTPGIEAGSEDNITTRLADILGGLSYNGLFPDRQIKLTDGYAEYQDGGSGHPFVRLIDHLIATGDLNGDGVEDAIALLVDYSTGSGDFIYLAPVLNVENEPLPLDALMIGDRSPVKSLTIDDGQVIVELVTQGPGDPLCCPTWNVRKLLNLEGGQLVEQSSQELSKLSLDDLNGTSWRLVDLNLDQEPVLPRTEITLNIHDGQINGSAGCNSYESVVTGDEVMPQIFVVDSIDSTGKICSGPIATQEIAYLQHLASVKSWRYDFGYLSLIYKLEQDVFGELLFAPK